jgi:hypothetical protein
VLARLERGARQRQVEVVRGADVDDVDVVGDDQRLGAVEATLGAQLAGGGGGAVRSGGRDTDDAGAGEPGGAGVDAADEPGADDPHPQRRDAALRCGDAGLGAGLRGEGRSLLHRPGRY